MSERVPIVEIAGGLLTFGGTALLFYADKLFTSEEAYWIGFLTALVIIVVGFSILASSLLLKGMTHNPDNNKKTIAILVENGSTVNVEDGLITGFDLGIVGKGEGNSISVKNTIINQ